MMAYRGAPRQRIGGFQIKRLESAGRVLKGAPRQRRADYNEREEKPWLIRPPGWSASLLEWVVWWYLTRHGVEPGFKKLRPGIDFFYQQALPSLGLQTTPFTREDFILPGARGGAFRGVVLDPYTNFTHPDASHDLRKRQILAGVGFRVVYLFDSDLTSDPQRVIELGRRGVDVSPRAAIGAFG